MILPWNYSRNKPDLRWSVSSENSRCKKGSPNALLWYSTLTKQTVPTGPSIQKNVCCTFFFFLSALDYFMARSPLNVYKCDILQSEWCKALKKKDLFRDHKRLRRDTTGYQFSLRPCQRDRAPIWRYINFVIEKGLHLPLDSFILFLSCWAALSAKCRL